MQHTTSRPTSGTERAYYEGQLVTITHTSGLPMEGIRRIQGRFVRYLTHRVEVEYDIPELEETQRLWVDLADIEVTR